MPETIEKLSPDRDLQCYYFDESAIAAFSEASATGFTVSGSWRQQFDWAVIEWNRDNVFEHPAFRTLPDGDLSGLTLTYDETRENCIAMDSDLAETVAWPYLRIWAGDNGAEEVYFVKLWAAAGSPDPGLAVPVAGAYSPAYANFTLSGTPAAGEHVGLTYTGPFAPGVHFVYEVESGDSLADILDGIAALMNASAYVRAEVSGSTLRVYYTGGVSVEDSVTGAAGNRFAMVSYASGPLAWDSAGKTFANGTSPTTWRVTIDFTSLQGRIRNTDGSFEPLTSVPTDKVRKMRWTYVADQPAGPFARTDFRVTVSNWTVTGSGRTYSVAGPGSRRIEDNDALVQYSGSWLLDRGNYSGGTIRYSETPGDSLTITYRASAAHTLYVGTRYLGFIIPGAQVAFTLDGVSAGSADLFVGGEDVLVRWPVGSLGLGTHTLTLTHTGSAGQRLYFDFAEIAILTTELPSFPSMPALTVATDWDTLHSVAIAPERTAWMIDSMGFHGRQNHYVGALLFYELFNPGNVFASRTITFSGTPEAGKTVWVEVGPAGGAVHIERTIQPGETLETIALSFAQEFNRGYTIMRATASGASLTIHARLLGGAGNDIVTAAYAESPMAVSPTSGNLTGGVTGVWRTDLAATPRLNRAMIDWTRSFLEALHGYGIDAVCAFSTELKHGDPSVAAGIAQRDSAGEPILLPTPALQTNFSPTSLAYWKQVHADCAQIMDEAGLVPYLQFGEEQWWYFPHDGRNPPDRVNFASMPFYDAWTLAEFMSRYGHAMAVFPDQFANPGDYPDEVEFLPSLIGEFTDAVMAHVRSSYPAARFEVLYPFDVNYTPFNRAINYPESHWTPGALDCLKTEGLSYTFQKLLSSSEAGMDMGIALGFEATSRAHLTGLGDSTAPWLKEAHFAEGKGYESVVLFALDQFCLIGYDLPVPPLSRRAVRVRR